MLRTAFVYLKKLNLRHLFAKISTYIRWGHNFGSNQVVRTPAKLCQPASLQTAGRHHFQMRSMFRHFFPGWCEANCDRHLPASSSSGSVDPTCCRCRVTIAIIVIIITGFIITSIIIKPIFTIQIEWCDSLQSECWQMYQLQMQFQANLSSLKLWQICVGNF